MTLALHYAARSDVGLRREGNEDSAYAGPHLLAVADGMGGHAAGEVASAAVITTIAPLDIAHAADDDLPRAIAGAVATASMRLRDLINDDPAREGMGTTLTAILWVDGHAALGHVGDSRAYLLRGGQLYQMTRDHTKVQTLLEQGLITEEEMATHPQRSVLMKALDGRHAVKPDVSAHETMPGDRYLLCSDGLSGVAQEADILQILRSVRNPDEAALQLIDLACQGGGPDNITCIVADVVDTAASGVPPTRAPAFVGAAANGVPGPGSTPGRSSTGPRPTAGLGRGPDSDPERGPASDPGRGGSGPRPTLQPGDTPPPASSRGIHPDLITTRPQQALPDDNEITYSGQREDLPFRVPGPARDRDRARDPGEDRDRDPGRQRNRDQPQPGEASLLRDRVTELETARASQEARIADLAHESAQQVRELRQLRAEFASLRDGLGGEDVPSPGIASRRRGAADQSTAKGWEVPDDLADALSPADAGTDASTIAEYTPRQAGYSGIGSGLLALGIPAAKRSREREEDKAEGDASDQPQG
jgi:serine/threonine protein phosphatase PrpC